MTFGDSGNTPSVYDIITPVNYTPGIQIAPLRLNSRCINFTEWITLFTLCLAPLIAHIASGTPPPSFLSGSRPKWVDWLCLYNPTSILWRYAAITDRRIRALHWTKDDLAASNAIFWTERGWDGGEDMMQLASPYCLRLPDHTHVGLLSVTMVKTIIVTLQGAGALYALISTIAGFTDVNFIQLLGVDTTFYPLAVLGLLRLCAAAWLTEDFVYANMENILVSPVVQRPEVKGDGIPLMESPSSYDPWLEAPSHPTARYKSPSTSWRSRFFRTFFFVCVAGCWAIAFGMVVPTSKDSLFTTTSFVVGSFYFLLFMFSTIIYGIYFFRGKTTSTTIPCIRSMWYKIYSCLMVVAIVLVIIVAAIETNKAPNGMYTSAAPVIDLDCRSLSTWYLMMQDHGFQGFFTPFGGYYTRFGKSFFGTEVAPANMTTSSHDQSNWLYSFTGYCVGRMNE